MRKYMTASAAGALCVWLAAGLAAQSKPVNPVAAGISAFNDQVKKYIDVHNKAESATAPLKSTTNPQEIISRETALAAYIKQARATAEQGDIFVPASVPVFKDIFSSYYKRRTGRERRLVFDEVPDFKPAVNMTYPVKDAKGTFPPRLSLALPQLPKELEYRIVSNELILRDVEANVIVDYLPNVLPDKPAGGPS